MASLSCLGASKHLVANYPLLTVADFDVRRPKRHELALAANAR